MRPLQRQLAEPSRRRQAGIYANNPEEATYPFTRTDADGQPLDGSKNNYTLTFAKDETPPVNSFWSLRCMTARRSS